MLVGEYYVNEIQVQVDFDIFYGFWIIGMFGFFEVLGEVYGGDLVLVIYGTNDLFVFGGVVLLGCIWVHNDVVFWLVFLFLGIFVEVRI